MKPLWSDDKDEEGLLSSMDSDVVIINLLEDIQCLKEDLKEALKEALKERVKWKKLEDKLIEVYDAGYDGIEYVALANYTSREQEAKDKLRKAFGWEK